jgi:surfeit locus 1 family protein
MQPRSRLLLLVLALAVAAVCVRLGFWQLSRLGQRRMRNAEATARLALPPVDLSQAPGVAIERFRRVTVAGSFDFARELALASRPRDGAPGVHIATPLLLAGHDTLILVLRGWAYSPDAATLDFARWHERDSVRVDGYALPFEPGVPSAAAPARNPRVVRRLDRAELEQRLSSPIAAYYVVMTSGGTSSDSTPPRLPEPVLDEGPHFSYAVQWFLFATIFGAGGAVVALRGRRSPPPGGSP